MSIQSAVLEGSASNHAEQAPVRRFLDLSTGHLNPDTRTLLDLICDAQQRGDLAAWAACTAFGWFVYADEEAKPGQYPDDLIVCMNKANDLGCNYILFDRDAAPAPASLGLPFYTEDCGFEATSHCLH